MGVKLWITNLMELRHAINGWPKSEDYVTVCDGGQHGSFDDEGYQKALAKAKEESIRCMWPSGEMITDTIAKPDTFIDWDGSIEVVYQALQGDVWADIQTKYFIADSDKYRQVARLKPVQSNPVVIPDQSDYATEEEFFEACRRQRRQVIPMNEEGTMTYAEMHEALDALKDPIKKELEAAKVRIKELEAQNKHMTDLLAKYSENE